MEPFNYCATAELYPLKNSRARLVGYRRFERAADAIRYAIEQLSPELLTGTYLEVEEARFDGRYIRQLYNNAAYPFGRSPASSSADYNSERHRFRSDGARLTDASLGDLPA
jgi:hypothetical protein